MPKRKLMDWKAARRIQSHADRTGRNQDFKARAMKAAYRNEKLGLIPPRSKSKK